MEMGMGMEMEMPKIYRCSKDIDQHHDGDEKFAKFQFEIREAENCSGKNNSKGFGMAMEMEMGMGWRRG